MPQLIAQFNPNAPGPTQSFPLGLPNGRGRIVIWNASNVQLNLTQGAYSEFCPAWIGNLYYLDGGPATMNWSAHSTLTSNGNPISLVVVLAYADSEKIPTNFPVPLHFQTNIGNPGAVSNSSSNLINDGNVAGTQIIEATPTGAAQSTISIANDGTITIYGDVGGTLTTLIQTVPGAAANAASVLLGDSARRVECLGNLKVDGPALNNLTAAFATQNGSISGSATFYQDMRGTVQRLVVVFNNFQQGAASLAEVLFPSGFTTLAQFVAGQIAPCAFFQGAGGAISCRQASGFGSGASVTTITEWTFGEIPGPFNRIQLASNMAYVANGILTIVGL